MTAPAQVQAPVGDPLDPKPRAPGLNPMQNAIQTRNSAYLNSNPYATPDNTQYWTQQDQLRQQKVGMLPNTSVVPQASVLNNPTADKTMLSSIDYYGKSALQGAKGSAQTQQIAAQAKQLKDWQQQSTDAQARAQAGYQSTIAGWQNGSGGQGNYASTTDNQIATWARQAGWAEANIPMVIAIAHAESGGNPGAINNSNANGSTDRGLMQINSIHADLLKTGDVMNPVDNLKMALQVYNDSGNWTPWSTFNNGAYNKFLTNPTFNAQFQTNTGNQVITTSTGLRMNLVQTAMKYLGTPYVWGGNSLTQGVDCSGLVQQLYSQFGISMPRTAAQDATMGVHTSISNLSPGDLIGWSGGGHIAIYAGNNEIIESPDVGLTVRRRALRDNEHDVLQGGNLIGIHLSLTGD